MPNIYPVPFMVARSYTVRARMVRVLFYSIVYPHKSNFEKLAIYPTLTLIERLPGCLVGAIGHEIAHIIALEGKVSISKSDLYSLYILCIFRSDNDYLGIRFIILHEISWSYLGKVLFMLSHCNLCYPLTRYPNLVMVFYNCLLIWGIE
jgi:hypothetical protein